MWIVSFIFTSVIQQAHKKVFCSLLFLQRGAVSSWDFRPEWKTLFLSFSLNLVLLKERSHIFLNNWSGFFWYFLKKTLKKRWGCVWGVLFSRNWHVEATFLIFDARNHFFSVLEIPLKCKQFFCSFDWKIIRQLINVFMKDCYPNVRNDHFIVPFSLLSHNVLIILMVVNAWIISSYLGTQVPVDKDVRSSNLITWTDPFLLRAFDCSLTT